MLALFASLVVFAAGETATPPPAPSDFIRDLVAGRPARPQD